MLAELFDAPAVTAQLLGEPDAALLYPLEAGACAGFAPKRRSEFAAGRLCARRVLAELGIHAFPIAVNEDRSPRWPPHVVGSISHTAGYACAVAARREHLRGIGIDAETVGRVTREIEPRLFTAPESAFLATLSNRERERAATVIFGAKEAFYKCQHPITRTWLDFTDVSIELRTTAVGGGEFVVHAAADAARTLAGVIPFPLTGAFRIDGDIALTGIALR